MNLMEGTTYEFRVLAENKAGRSEPSASTGPVVVREVARGNAPVVTEQLEHVYAKEGEDAVLECMVTGDPQPDIVW